MKKLGYRVKSYTNIYNPDTGNVEQREVFVGVETEYTKANEETAKREAYNGEYTVEDDGQPEPDTATADDVLNALLGVTV